MLNIGGQLSWHICKPTQRKSDFFRYAMLVIVYKMNKEKLTTSVTAQFAYCWLIYYCLSLITHGIYVDVTKVSDVKTEGFKADEYI